MKQCYKICNYLQKVRQIEILQMKAEFLRDENQNIWLHYVRNIKIRRIEQKWNLHNITSSESEPNAVQQLENQQKAVLLGELQDFQEQSDALQKQATKERRAPKDRASVRMLNVLDEYYGEMKDAVGIDPHFCVDEDDTELEQVLVDMKRNAKPTNFKPFLHRSQNFDKSTPWKRVSRKVADDDRKQ